VRCVGPGHGASLGGPAGSPQAARQHSTHCVAVTELYQTASLAHEYIGVRKFVLGVLVCVLMQARRGAHRLACVSRCRGWLEVVSDRLRRGGLPACPGGCLAGALAPRRDMRFTALNLTSHLQYENVRYQMPAIDKNDRLASRLGRSGSDSAHRSTCRRQLAAAAALTAAASSKLLGSCSDYPNGCSGTTNMMFNAAVQGRGCAVCRRADACKRCSRSFEDCDCGVKAGACCGFERCSALGACRCLMLWFASLYVCHRCQSIPHNWMAAGASA